MPNTPAEIGQAYAQLALAIEQHQAGYIDAYFGPPAWKAQAEQAGKQPLDTLLARARELVQAIQHADLNAQRQRFLTKQVTAMQTTLRLLLGEHVPFVEEVEQLYDATPQRVSDDVLDEAMRDLARLMPGQGPITERMRARRKKFEISNELAWSLFALARDETRRRTRQRFALPDNESIELTLVKDKPWSAYNWYLGQHRSLIELNTDSPFHANGIVGLLAHEGYAGHHTEHASKEQVLYEQHGYVEQCVLLINAPECVISEGIATTAADVIFDEGEVEAWTRAELYPRAGIVDELSPEEVERMGQAGEALGGVSGNAALMLHVDGKSEEEVIAYLLKYSGRARDEAERSIRFLRHPLYRSYTYTYSYGHELVTQLFKQQDKVTVFKRLLSEPLTPTDLRAWLAASS
jgi:hypothetical protein